MKGGETMAIYFAKLILEETVTYKQVFAFAFYRRYKPAVDEILTLEGRADLIQELD